MVPTNHQLYFIGIHTLVTLTKQSLLSTHLVIDAKPVCSDLDLRLL